MKILQVMKHIIYWIGLIAGTLILTFGFSALIGILQEVVVHGDYDIRIFKFPLRNLEFVYEMFFFILMNFILNKDYRKSFLLRLKSSFIKKNKKIVIAGFVIVNVILLYALLFNMATITNNKIIDYSFFAPSGKEYNFNDIVKIETGIYGKKNKIPLSHYSKGDFFYIVQLDDGTEIHLTDVGGTKNDEDDYSVIEKIDSQLVNRNIQKVSSMEYFEYCTKDLDKAYTDKIKSIIQNIK